MNLGVYGPRVTLIAASLALACSSESGFNNRKVDPTERDAAAQPEHCVDGDDACGLSCGDDSGCPEGLYCDDEGSCAKDCTQTRLCPSSFTCPSNGRCVMASPTPFDAGINPQRDSAPPMTCADTLVHTSTVTPNVILIVDQSSSMDEDFENNESRWNVLRDFLLEDPSGLIAELQTIVRFGLALYSAESGGDAPDPIGECPMMTTVAPALMNYQSIADVYGGAEPIEDTPTGDAINYVLDNLAPIDPDQEVDPTVFIIATDGEPDHCGELDPQNGQSIAIEAVERAFTQNIRTFIISVGEGTVSTDHQQDMANAGLGREPGDENAEFWVAGDDQSLRDALRDIVGSQISCELELDGAVESGDPCDGRVLLNGEDLYCDDPDGWELVDPSHIRLLGGSCDQLKAGDALLDVRFPCDVAIVF